MKKRLRKKLHKGEFTEYGFALYVRFKPFQDDDKMYEAFCDFTDLIDSIGVFCGGLLGDRWDLALSANKPGSISYEQKEKIIKWLTTQENIIKWSISDPVDMWNVKYMFDYDEEKDRWIKK